LTMNNFFDYLFEDTKGLTKKFILNPKEEISFGELYHNSINLSGKLSEKSCKGKCIIVLSHNNQFFVTAYLSIIKSGNIVVPLNPDIEQRNLDYIISQCNVATAFVSKTSRLSFEGIENVYNEDNVLEILQIPYLSTNEVETTENADTEAEIIFTSGSTGSPKGVVLSHKNLMANTTSIVQYLKLTSSDVMLVVLPFYYCYGLSLLHTHLRVGGSIAFNNAFIFIGGILKDLNLYNCTGFAGVPSHYQVLLRKSKSFITSAFPSLRYVTQAGGKLPVVFINEFVTAFPKVLFYVMYGQTEATARLAYLPPHELSKKAGSVGKAIPGVTLKVLDEEGAEVAPGATGEIIAQGNNIMKGYFKDEALTAETIKNCWLHTGDLATVDEDGYIFIQSRKKDFIKVGGKRISPKEVEEVILMLPQVVDCTVVGVPDELLGEAMKAGVVIADGQKDFITLQDITYHCQKHLPLYKVPTHIEFESALRVSAAGKKTKY
jgi:long-chain acyl-CoA synthetase